MRPFLLKNLLLSSLLLWILGSCSPITGYKLRAKAVMDEVQVKPVIRKEKAQLFKARIKVYNKHYSGLILLKQLDPNTARLTFVTEIGMKMFDYEIQNNQLKLVYIFEPLNKPRILQLLQSDLKFILLQDLFNQEATIYGKKDKLVYKVKKTKNQYYSSKLSHPFIEKSRERGFLFTKRKVNYTYNDSLDLTEVKLKHTSLIRVNINLNRIANP